MIQMQSFLDVADNSGARLVRVFRTSSHSQRSPHSPANFLDQQAQNSVFERTVR